MEKQNSEVPVLELRVAVTTSAFGRMTKFYFDALGIPAAQTWDNGQGRAVILNMGEATLEIFDEKQAATIDQIEAGKRVSGQVRFALQVPDMKSAVERLLAHGATMVHPPIVTPGGIPMHASRIQTGCRSHSLRDQERLFDSANLDGFIEKPRN